MFWREVLLAEGSSLEPDRGGHADVQRERLLQREWDLVDLSRKLGSEDATMEFVESKQH